MNNRNIEVIFKYKGIECEVKHGGAFWKLINIWNVKSTKLKLKIRIFYYFTLLEANNDD